jgi:hypothetical protein
MRVLTDQGQIIALERRWARERVRLFVACLFLAPLCLMLGDDFGYFESAHWQMDLLSHLLVRYVPLHVSEGIFSFDGIPLNHEY